MRTADAGAGPFTARRGPSATILRVLRTMRILSGIQPSGALHIGNYFGALRQFIDLQRENDAYYFVANYHALTSVRDAEQLRAYTFDVIVTMLSLGLDPDRATLFVQSDVPETAELAWLLTTVTPMGWLEKAVSYKDKVQQGLPADHGLFAYPVLQAADILLYDADLVPVGQDQKQHLEITRDIAERFNHVYGGGKEVFRLPKPYILDSVSVVPGLDGRKMSKSYNNTIDIFDEPAAIKKKVKRIVTDSTPVEAPKNPETDALFNLFKLFAAGDELAEVERRYREGGIGYGEVKNRLAEAMIARFAPAREQRAEWLRTPNASTRSAPPPPTAPGPRPASSSTAPARRAAWREEARQSFEPIEQRLSAGDSPCPSMSARIRSLTPCTRSREITGRRCSSSSTTWSRRPASRPRRPSRGTGRPRSCLPCPPPSGTRSWKHRLRS